MNIVLNVCTAPVTDEGGGRLVCHVRSLPRITLEKCYRRIRSLARRSRFHTIRGH